MDKYIVEADEKVHRYENKILAVQAFCRFYNDHLCAKIINPYNERTFEYVPNHEIPCLNKSTHSIHIFDINEGFSHMPIFMGSNGWYFWDETWAYANGPFPSYAQCYTALYHYCIYEL